MVVKVDTLQAQAPLVARSTVYLLLCFAFGFFACGLSRAFTALIILVAMLRLFIVATHKDSCRWSKSVLAIVVVSASVTISNIRVIWDALPGANVILILLPLFAFALAINFIAIGVIYIDYSLCSWCMHPWSQLVLFPALWATTMHLLATVTTLGSLFTWSPTYGVDAYDWLRPIVGPIGIDWFVGCWSVILSEVAGAWIACFEREYDVYDTAELASTTADSGEDDECPKRSLWIICLSAFLCCLALPSYTLSNLPIPIYSTPTKPLHLACALPFVKRSKGEPTLEEYVDETKRLVSSAKVVLWPENAIRLTNDRMKKEIVDQVADIAAGSLVGIAFEGHISTQNATSELDGLRSGLMIVDKNGIVMEYYKRHLTPLSELGRATQSGSPAIFDYELVTKQNSRKRPTEFLTVPILASFGLDFALDASFGSLSRRPSLILGPARTYHQSFSLALWQQAKARAEEVGSALLFCDGGIHGVSGIAGRGTGAGEIVQVGPGSWVRTIGIDTTLNDTRTPYGKYGAWMAIALVWCVFALGWAVAKMATVRKIGSVSMLGVRSPFKSTWWLEIERSLGQRSSERWPLL